MAEIVIMDFSGIYKEEQFFEGEKVSWLDVREIPGTNCYCDDEAKTQILEKLEEFSAGGIYFIDSGNYHYMSRIGIERVKEPFRLLVFDNHTDMQLPTFGGLLSCGGWIASAIEEAENLVEVWLVGPDEEAYSQVEEPLKEKVKFFSREMLQDFRNNESYSEKTNNMERNVMDFSFLGEIPTDLPLYVSIDKDVLGTTDASTTWSQGDMTLGEMMAALEFVTRHFKEAGGKILQVDICGECDPDGADNERNDAANRELLKFWKNFFAEQEDRGALL